MVAAKRDVPVGVSFDLSTLCGVSENEVPRLKASQLT